MKNHNAAKSSEAKGQKPAVDSVPPWMTPDLGESMTGDI